MGRTGTGGGRRAVTTHSDTHHVRHARPQRPAGRAWKAFTARWLPHTTSTGVACRRAAAAAAAAACSGVRTPAARSGRLRRVLRVTSGAADPGAPSPALLPSPNTPFQIRLQQIKVLWLLSSSRGKISLRAPVSVRPVLGQVSMQVS